MVKGKNKGSGQRNAVRIIGGQWRRRLLPIPEAGGVRPTPDRVKETLFNWLGPGIEGASCLDLFAGSGSLGLEAASRGARRVVCVENHPAIAAHLRREAQALGAGDVVEVVVADAPAWLGGQRERFDVVFVDPPFGDELAAPALAALHRSQVLTPGARIYLETGNEFPESDLPDGWRFTHARRAGKVRYHLARPGPDRTDE